jgi:hypothetical protein
MEALTLITTDWKEPLAVASYPTGVSLHSHTSVSEETLDFVNAMCSWVPGFSAVLNHYGKRCRENYGMDLNFARANWRPPLQPRMAYDLEARQIQRLWLMPLVSITDHDSMEAPLLLRTVPSSRHIPLSTEWSVPYGQTVFHLGIHNVPSADGVAWMRRFREYTADADAVRKQLGGDIGACDRKLLMMLRELHELPQVLIVFNHPIWDLYKVGAPAHLAEVRRFLAEAGPCIHAIELNGLRHAQENREAGRLARETGHLVISGGDRHGLEANANINLTHAANFTEFVEEVRVDRRSHVHFMAQYRNKWEQRILASTLNAVTDFPQFLPGWQKWDDRVFHPDANGEMRQLSELWPRGRPPLAMRALINTVRLGRSRAMSASLSLAFPGVNRLGVEMESLR